MKVLVLGGGVVGVTSAYELARDGHEVTVVEQAADVGEDASAGNAGMIAPGHSYAWASPAAPGLLVRSIFGAETAIRVKPRSVFSPRLMSWGLRFLRECSSERAMANTRVKYRLCAYSQERLDALLAEEPINYAAGERGMFYLYDSSSALEAGYERTEILRKQGRELVVLDADGCVEREPALGPVRDQISGAIYGVADQAGECRMFTKALTDLCRQRGVEIRTATRVETFARSGRSERVDGVRTVTGELLTADAYVVALGVGSPALARTAGKRIAIYPAKGYSSTFPVRDDGVAPAHGGVDEATLVAWSRYGDRLRVSATAEFAGYDRSWRHADFAGIHATMRRLFPTAAHYDKGEYRACLRPMTPDGPPIISGLGGGSNLFFNCGHGHMGWTMACGSARVLADVVGGRQPDIDTAGMEVR